MVTANNAKSGQNQVSKIADSETANGTRGWKVLGSRFELPLNYEIIDAVGSGAYGVVVAAKDTEIEDESDNLVAIKKIEKAFEHKVFTLRTLRELKIMRLLNHENVLSIKSILMPKSLQEFNELYVVSDLMETDLAQIIKSNQVLSDEHIQFFLYQILRGLKYIHSCGILHRDLKPRNLLVNSNCDLKICDFGLARATINTLMTSSASMTDYIATRWYRAPEVILSWRQYSAAIDVWSVGCILAELIRRKPLLPATTEQEQMMMITNLIGKPSNNLINQIEDNDNRTFMKQLPNNKGKDFNELFRGGIGVPTNPHAIDLMKKMLTFDPAARITIEEALAHPYMERLHFEEDEPVGTPVCDYDFDFELFSLKILEYKELIYEEIQLYHSDESMEAYKRDKEENPKGKLHTRYPKERLRTMYKQDPSILSIYSNRASTSDAAASSSATASSEPA